MEPVPDRWNVQVAPFLKLWWSWLDVLCLRAIGSRCFTVKNFSHEDLKLEIFAARNDRKIMLHIHSLREIVKEAATYTTALS